MLTHSTCARTKKKNEPYFVHERDDLQDELILPQIVSVFEDDGVHGSILSFEDQLSWHQSTLTQTHKQKDLCSTDMDWKRDKENSAWNLNM